MNSTLLYFSLTCNKNFSRRLESAEEVFFDESKPFTKRERSGTPEDMLEEMASSSSNLNGPSPKIAKIPTTGEMLQDDKEQLDELLAMFAFSFKEPLALMDNPHFINLVQALRPGYKVPSKKKLSSSLLFRCHKRVQEMDRTKTREKLSYLYHKLNNYKFDSKDD